MNPSGNRALALLGLPALPLAFVALPLYVIWPHYFATQFGVSIGLIGGLLLIARLLDALLDPLLGLGVDRLLQRGSVSLLRRSWLVAVTLASGFLLLFFPHWLTGNSVTIETLLLLMLAALVVSYLSYSFLNIALQTWGARLAGDDLMLLDLDSTRESRRGSDRWVQLFMSSLVLAIAGGASNIQRNIIAERSLGLPRE